MLTVFKFNLPPSSTSPKYGSVEVPLIAFWLPVFWPVVSRPMSQNFASPTGTASQVNCVLSGTAPLVAKFCST